MEKDKRKGSILLNCLGLLWLIDGFLQLQPQMFSSAFIDNVLKPNLPNQPQFMVSGIALGIHLFAAHMRIENFLSASIQLIIGLLLLLPVSWAWKRLALWASIPWCLLVWVFGEGVGNLLTGTANFYTGAPGAVFLYFLLALFLLFPQKLPIGYLPRVAGVLFLLGGSLFLSPLLWAKGMQAMLWQLSQQDSISSIAAPAKWLSEGALTMNVTYSVAIGILVILGTLLAIKPTKILGWIVFAFLFVVWWVSQDFGGVFTFPFGTATDLNSAPLFMVFLLPLLVTQNKHPFGNVGAWLASIYQRQPEK